MKRNIVLYVFIGLFAAGCVMLGQRAPKKDPKQEVFEELMTAFENRAYESSITAAQQFLSQYPKKSGRKDVVLVRLGESFEGLLKQNYQDLVDEGVDEGKARTTFLAKYGHYNCWETQNGALVYNKAIFRQLFEENPKSNYADEAYYNLFQWSGNLDEDPPRIEPEITHLKEVLRKFPTTSLSPKILFQIGYRFHLLYEIYSFSKDPTKRSDAKAQESFHQAENSYNLCLNVPHGSEYSKKAFRNLEMLRQGARVFIK